MKTLKDWCWLWGVLLVGCAEPTLHSGDLSAQRSADEVAVFHTPPGADHAELLFVDPDDVADHLAHGDHLGSVVGTTDGPVVGVVDRPEEGDLRVFRGIPYAKAPVGDLRWRPPVPPDPWEQPLDASEPGPICPQVGFLPDLPWVTMDEDCLSLSVWAPAHPEAPRPVMVWIHGGGYWWGSGSQRIYDGRTLVEENGVIVVSLNYRLGALGFFTDRALAEEQGSAGNYGLLDQRRALEWVHDNIAAFGGDPGNVTLFGQSAGSASACDQIVAEPLRDPSGRPVELFHRAILESGACDATGPDNGGSNALRPTLECSDPDCPCPAPEPGTAEDTPEARAAVLACLRALPASVLVAAQSDVDGAWAPTIDGQYLVDSPRKLFARRSFHPPDVSLLVGATANEGTRLIRSIPIDWDPCTGFSQQNYDDFVDWRIAGWESDPDVQAQIQAGNFDASTLENTLHSLYDPPLSAPYWAAAALEGDWRMTCPTHDMARWASADTDIWLYLYAYTGFTIAGDTCTEVSPMGASHANEIPFVFDNENWGALDPEEQAFSARIRGYWTRFATTGDPNPDPAGPEWPKYDVATDAHLVLDVGKVHLGFAMRGPWCGCFWSTVYDTLFWPGPWPPPQTPLMQLACPGA